jgi:hypothetical protein
VGLLREIVERDNASDNRCERCGDLGIGDVGSVLLPVDHKTVDFRIERVLHLAGGARELDYIAAWANVDLRESLRSEPLRDELNVGIGDAKLLAKLL